MAPPGSLRLEREGLIPQGLNTRSAPASVQARASFELAGTQVARDGTHESPGDGLTLRAAPRASDESRWDGPAGQPAARASDESRWMAPVDGLGALTTVTATIPR
jgi:hypothetical protein